MLWERFSSASTEKRVRDNRNINRGKYRATLERFEGSSPDIYPVENLWQKLKSIDSGCGAKYKHMPHFSDFYFAKLDESHISFFFKSISMYYFVLVYHTQSP
ncbi:hypothetical protein CHARACLAT_000997 [Characodon lateralis]|uniref:Uncharacterized protein n=1 Tax=Characodon lateralis TaxID=208331 RepID=A0ABU7DP57_9TELE|nr:hypothetical protein [Characodon lateralis]